MAELRTYENFPLRIVLLTNLFSLAIYLIGFYILLNLGILFAVLFAVYVLWIEIRLLQQHKQGNIRGSQFRKALGQKYNLDNEPAISSYIRDNCSFQFLPVKSFEETVRLEHFATAILAPVLNTDLKQ